MYRVRNMSDHDKKTGVGLVKTDMRRRGRLLDTSVSDLMWAEQAPEIILKELASIRTALTHSLCLFIHEQLQVLN